MTPSSRWVMVVLAALSLVAGARVDAGLPPLPTYGYAALLDTDNNMATGGPVPVVQGSETPHNEVGIDYVVAAVAGIGGPPGVTTPGGGAPLMPGAMVLKTEVSRWNGTSFALVHTDSNTYPLGTNANGDGSVEFGVPLEWIGNPHNAIRGLFHATSEGVADNDYTGPFFIRLPVQAPALSLPPLVGLGTLLMVSAIVLILRRKGAAVRSVVVACLTAATVVWAAAIVLDGDFADWSGISPVVTDPTGDSSISDPAEDILAGYAVIQGSNIFFRMDLDGLIAPF